jgi:D-cysteine desulfhydrase
MQASTQQAHLPLFEAFPRLAEAVAWVPLGHYPTALEAVTLRPPGGGAREILVKRDDRTGEPYGGNKVRKLEFILGAARSAGATRLITAGAAGSHHALATAVYGRALGFAVSLVLFPQRVTPHVRDILRMDHAYGAELRWTPRMEGVPFALLRARRAHAAERPFTVAPGGSDPLGTLGYVNAGLELAGQIGALEDRPSAIHLAAGTLGTAAGLALGLALAGEHVPVRAVRITSRLVANERALRRLVYAVAQVLNAAGVPADAAAACSLLTLHHDQIGEGYGRETPAARAATETFAAAGLRLDATYTAKAAADVLAAPATARRPLFVHTLSAAEPLDRARDVAPEDLPQPFARYLAGEHV